MKTINFLIFFFCIAILQVNAKAFEGFYVDTKNDTIQCTFNVGVNLFNNKLLNPLSFRKKVKVTLTDGRRLKLSPSDVQMFSISGTSEGTEVYVPLKLKNKDWFVRLRGKGKVNVYEYFYPHGYDYSVQKAIVLEIAGKDPMLLARASRKKSLLKYMDNDSWFASALKAEKLVYDDIPELVLRYNAAYQAKATAQQ